jgi:hypothetical protein
MGARRAFGPRDEVLKEVLVNHEAVARTKSAGGVS